MISKVDGKGRVLIPKKVRESMNLSEGTLVSINVEGNAIIIKRAESAADRYYGKFKVKKWPKDLDEVLKKEVIKWSD